MMLDLIDELEVAPPAVVRQAAHDFAAALAAAPEFEALDEAAARLRADAAARQAMVAFQEKQRSLQAVLMLGAASVEEQAELERLREAYLAQPAVTAYFQAEEQLRVLCQQVAGTLSAYINFDYVAACGGGCC
jgi:cell fate (sporulation/competence/biofilm development) regulator YlbF (YheA/YmcA/DUF963 family)